MPAPPPDSPRRGTLRQRQKAATRATLLETARRQFAEKGFERTTIRDIAREAGVALGTIFNHFADKEALLIASAIDDLGGANRRAWTTVSPHAPVREKMLHLATEGYRAWLRRPSISRVLIREMCFTSGPERDELRALDRDAIAEMAALLEEAKASGEVRADVDSHLAVKTAFSVYLTTILYWLDDSDAADATAGEPGSSAWVEAKLAPMVEETDRFLAMLFRGIGGRAGAGPDGDEEVPR